MLGIFKSKWTRAVEEVADFIPNMLKQYGKIPSGIFRDSYCLGFLEIVGVHVASEFLEKGSGMEKARAVFEDALKRIAPHHASEATELLRYLHANESYLRGRKDGDFYMGWKLMNLATQPDGEAALERFFDRVGYIDSPTKQPAPSTPPKAAPAAPPLPHTETEARSPHANTGKWQVVGSGHEFIIARTYFLPVLTPVERTATLKIICTVRSSPEVNWVCSDLRFNLKPIPHPFESSLVLGLFTEEPKGALVEVEARRIPEDSRDKSLDVVMLVHSDDVSKLLRALSSGSELTFILLNTTAPDKEPFVNVPPDFLTKLSLPNDNEFKKLYDEACEQVARCQDATRARQLGEGWYRRRTPEKNA